MINLGKPQKVALTAIVRMLLERANALVKAYRERVPIGTRLGRGHPTATLGRLQNALCPITGVRT